MATPSAPLVLIAGAGPTGLTLAVALRHQGVAVRIVERLPAPSGISKALAVWPASLESFAGLGLIDDFLAAGLQMHSLRAGDGAHQVAEIPVGEGVDSPYPKPILLPQSRTEALLEHRLAALGTTVERGLELVDLAQDDGGVDATVQRADGSRETICCTYLVGCDGARSAVRHQTGIEFEGYTEPQTFLLADAPLAGEIDPASIYVWWAQGGTTALFPVEAGTWRVMAVREGESDAPPTRDEMQSHLERFGPPGLTMGTPTWLSAFRINERLAARYRDRRVFLAGDAAHIHSPAGGQGMNTGIHDAVNLAWKLAYALRGQGRAERLLDSYEAERRPIARHVVDDAALRLHATFGATGRLQRLARDVAIAALAHLPPARRKLQIELSETRIHYDDGALVEAGRALSAKTSPVVGARALDAAYGDDQGVVRRLWPSFAGPGHCLLLFGERAAFPLLDRAVTELGLGAALTVLHLTPGSDPDNETRQRYGLSGQGWILVRPDQFVAARGTGDSDDAFRDYATLALVG